MTEKGRIEEFQGEYRFLSNFFPSPLEVDGIRYGNAEAAFQAQKVLSEEEKREFSDLPPNVAKRKGRRVSLRPDWEEVKTEMMEKIVRAKFEENPELTRRLLETGDAELIEGNSWNDRCWGVDLRTGKGENRLGLILMKIRQEKRESLGRK